VSSAWWDKEAGTIKAGLDERRGAPELPPRKNRSIAGMAAHEPGGRICGRENGAALNAGAKSVVQSGTSRKKGGGELGGVTGKRSGTQKRNDDRGATQKRENIYRSLRMS